MSPAPQEPLPAERFAEILAGREPEFEITLDDPARTSLSAYLAELDRWRRTTNLTGQLSATELAAHALEALVAAPLISDGERIVDIGSGAGFPGLPLAIARPGVNVTLVEPRARRAAFLRHVLRTIPVGNAAVMEARIENVGGQTYDAATTRAVGGFSSWIGKAGFLKDGGRLLAWTTDGLEVAREIGPRLRLDREIAIPGSTSRRIAVLIKAG